GKNSLNRLIRCVCGKKIGPDPRNFNQRVSLGRNDLLIRTFLRSYIRAGIYQKKSSDPVQLLAVLDNSIMVKYFKDEKPTYARMTTHLPNKNESYECLIKIQHELIRSEEK
ncbi:hypothetical protein OIU03_28800, partial [Escherichia coli]|nr:hypothetical protein [Escherichia coli]